MLRCFLWRAGQHKPFCLHSMYPSLRLWCVLLAVSEQGAAVLFVVPEPKPHPDRPVSDPVLNRGMVRPHFHSEGRHVGATMLMHRRAVTPLRTGHSIRRLQAPYSVCRHRRRGVPVDLKSGLKAMLLQVSTEGCHLMLCHSWSLPAVSSHAGSLCKGSQPCGQGAGPLTGQVVHAALCLQHLPAAVGR